MMVEKEYHLETMDNIKSYNNYKYKTDPNKFIRNRILAFEDYVFYGIQNEGRTTAVEVNSYLDKYMNDDMMTITKQAISSQRQFIEPLIFKDMMLDTLIRMKNDGAYPKGFKDKPVLGVDGSDLDVPPHKITIEEFNIPQDTMMYKQPAQTLCSSISDLYNNYIWDIELADADDDERSIFLQQLDRLDQKIDLHDTIFVFDRGYPSIEMFLECLEKETFFIFRLKSDIYSKERNKMLSDDEYVNLNLNSLRTKNIRNPKIKEKIKNMTHLRLRIVNIPIQLNNGKIITETLITNLPPETASKEELKELYNKRWDIEKNYDKMKNILEIENYSGYKKCIIQQDTYAQAFLLNFLHSVKHDCEKKIPEEKKTSKNGKLSYQINMNTLAGIMIDEMPKLFSDDPQKRKNTLKKLEKLATTNLSSSKTEKKEYPRKKDARKYKYKLHKRRAK